MNIIVVGCGRVGAQLAYRLFLNAHRVTVVDSNPAAFRNLPSDFLGRVVEGEATHQDVLLRAGIEQADGLAVVTNSDPINAIIGHIALTTYNLPNVVIRNYDPTWRPMLDAFHLQVISSTTWGAQRIEELLSNSEMRTVYSAGNGEVEVYEFTIPVVPEGFQLAELFPKEGCIPVGLTRSGSAILPTNDTLLQRGDIIAVSATFTGVQELVKRLKILRDGAK